MQIHVRRGGFGVMEGGVLALGIIAGLLSLIDPTFRPIGASAIVLGAVVAAILVWRRRSESHPTISRHARLEEDEPIEPK